MTHSTIEFYLSDNIEGIDFSLISNKTYNGNVKIAGGSQGFDGEEFDITIDRKNIGILKFKFESYESSQNLRLTLKIQETAYENEIEKLKLDISSLLLHNYYEKCFWLKDYQSEYFHEELVRDFYRLENKFRNFINLVMIKIEGPNWFQEESPSKFIKLHGHRSKPYKEAVKSFAEIEDSLYSLLTDDLVELLDLTRETFPLKITSNEQQKLEKALLLAKDNKNGIAQLLVSIQEKKMSIFDMYFAQLTDRKLINEWRKITKKRNHIAHNKLLDSTFKNDFKKDMEAFSEILNQASNRFDSINPSNEEDEYRRLTVLGKKPVNIMNAIAESESGINVRNENDIFTIMSEIIDDGVDILYESLSERKDIEISNNNSFSNEEGRLLLLAEYKPMKTEIKVTVDTININDDPGEESEIVLRIKNDTEEEIITLKYVNGEYEYNEAQGNYLPVVDDQLFELDFIEQVQGLEKSIEDVFPNLLEEAIEIENSYEHVSQGLSPIILEYEECPNCGETDCLTTDLEYFDELNKSYSNDSAICLACGETCSVNECSNCGNTFVTDSDAIICDSCKDYINREP